MKEKSTAAKTAQAIRKELKISFPETKFSVRSSQNSMSDSVSVAWTDGPSSSNVDPILSKFKLGSFDGMTDSYSFNPDRNKSIPQVYYVFTSRSYSDDVRAEMKKSLSEKYQIDMDDEKAGLAKFGYHPANFIRQNLSELNFDFFVI